jgi:hypothetical protein
MQQSIVPITAQSQIRLEHSFQPVSLMRLRLADSQIFELTEPLIGRDCLSGFLEDGKSWLVVKKDAVLGIELQGGGTAASLSIWSRKSAAELIAVQPLPQLAEVRYAAGGPAIKLWAVSASRGFLVVEGAAFRMLPIAALQSLVLQGCG